MSKETKIPFNRSIDMSLSGVWHVDKDSGMEALANYVNEVGLLTKKVITYQELNHAKGRKEQMSLNFQPTTFSQDLKIQEFNLEGIMRSQDNISHYGVGRLVSQMRNAINDPTVAAGLLIVESGGGDILAAQKMQNAVADFSSTKPLYALVHKGGSAAFKAILPISKNIYLSGSNALIGSIGAMLTLDKEFPKQLKEKFHIIYPKTSPDKNQEMRALMEDNLQPFMTYAEGLDAAFMSDVRKAIPNITEKALRGGMFIGEAGVAENLAVGIKTKQELLQKINSDLISNNKKSSMNFSINTKFFNMIAAKFGWSAEDTQKANTQESFEAQLEATESMSVQIKKAVDAATLGLNAELSNLKTELSTLKQSSGAIEKKTEDITKAQASDMDTVAEAMKAMNATMVAMTSAIGSISKKSEENGKEVKEVAATVAEKKGEEAPTASNAVAPELKAAEESFLNEFGDSEAS